MPITSSAKKALRAAKRRKVFNDRRRKTLRETIKKLEALAKEGSYDKAVALLPAAYKAVDKAAKRGVIEARTAARRKARVAHAVSAAKK
ncbi:MAG: hypothetical protein A3D67_02260 [Candidatus Lloydbacteria bacterium RIFCSPHIGHO2_02_FULL_51_22]|uniref:Small ribosomal subunit protein bS20 n=2 Tax=Candidatus Lloydiibacteriota TaxID=1817910 RepID=A0A1G2DCK7_9BACT|nr:MAG: hypothetical protein A3D67_02260 [Candidatus Lloydbacteria bacterium RIFCSPHIGHO2_02_FULL_51_22]OGZ16882.1 MAG: hypothetical protein A3G11_01430 [Candidatus Lloydbacteria bacterium RIFCSPLOWO2_12_FULL_51_9]